MSIRVLIVDDSSFFRKRLADIINADPELTVIGTAEDGQQAILQAKTLKPDIITMDIEMPKLDGISAVKRIMAESPTAILMLSSMTTAGAKATFDALEAGAMDYMPKQFGDLTKRDSTLQQKLCQRLHQLASHYNQPQIQPSRKAEHSALDHLKLITIGTSTGGPIALQTILSELPNNFPLPIIVVQHMPETFTPSFAERLNDQCAITIKHADDGDDVIPGTVYIAPGGKQLHVAGSANKPKIQIQNSASDQPYRPCIDITLNSIAKLCPAESLTIILTGMGSDGSEGCKKLKQLGATVWSQDEQSSTIYGMPMAIAKANLADKILNLADIGPQLSKIKVP